MLRKFNQLSLFKTILLWVALSIVAYTTLSAVWGQGSDWKRILTGWQLGKDNNPLDRIKVTLTALGGIGAVGYLVIKYRERAAFERGEADDKLVRAVQQLGDSSPQVRIAGVYALADVADTYEGPYHQRVVDILCGYLRTDRLLRDSNGNPRYATVEEGDPEDSPLSSDSATESTILSVLSSHLKSGVGLKSSYRVITTPGPWSHCTLDLHGAIITEMIDFSETHIKEINSQETWFTRNTYFQDATFEGEANFWNSVFTQDADFGNTLFKTDADFENATFSRYATFQSTRFAQNASFQKSRFKQSSDFRGSKFLQNAMFQDVTFEQIVNFRNSTFRKILYLNHSTFNQSTTFDDSTFRGGVHIKSSHMHDNFSLKTCKFSNKLKIESTAFEKGVNFENSIFLNDAKVDSQDVKFGESSNFKNTIFLSDITFTDCNFNGVVHFLHTAFLGDINVQTSTFVTYVDFDQSHFKGYVNFLNNTYMKGVGFTGAKFNSNLKGSTKMRFPDGISFDLDGIPTGASWMKFKSIKK